jgi:hypothetical protein
VFIHESIEHAGAFQVVGAVIGSSTTHPVSVRIPVEENVPVVGWWLSRSGRAWRPLGSAGVELIRPKQRQAGATDAFDGSFALELPQDSSGHHATRPDQTVKVRPAQDGRLAEEQVPMLCQDPNHPTPGVVMERAYELLDGCVH